MASLNEEANRVTPTTTAANTTTTTATTTTTVTTNAPASTLTTNTNQQNGELLGASSASSGAVTSGPAFSSTLVSGGYSSNGDSIEELSKEVESLKKKLEEERAKFNDVECECAVFRLHIKYIFFTDIGRYPFLLPDILNPKKNKYKVDLVPGIKTHITFEIK